MTGVVGFYGLKCLGGGNFNEFRASYLHAIGKLLWTDILKTTDFRQIR